MKYCLSISSWRKLFILHLLLSAFHIIHIKGQNQGSQLGELAEIGTSEPNLLTASEMKLNDTEEEARSFKELFFKRRAGREVNVTKLVAEYALICPMSDSCGVDINDTFVYTDLYFGRDFPDCEYCQCDRKCMDRQNCCPGSIYGYVQHDCINGVVYPETHRRSYKMVGQCNSRYKTSSTVIELCNLKTAPCNGEKSGFTFKNPYCAICNDDSGCIPWKLTVSCKKTWTNRTLASLTKLKTDLDVHDCKVEYVPDLQTHGSNEQKCDEHGDTSKSLVSRCNVSGLWNKFDADIDWACQNFVNPYKQFKNIFCYICNPSEANKQMVNMTDFCAISTICKNLPSSDRMWPFKNIYCYERCDFKYSFVSDSMAKNVWFKKIYEHKYTQDLTSNLFLEMLFSDVKDLENFVRQELQTTFQFSRSRQYRDTTKTKYSSSDINDIIDEYVTVCGTGHLCNLNTTVYTNKFFGSPVCDRCSCDNICAERKDCCPDVYIIEQPYSCVKDYEFPELSKTDLSATSRKYSNVSYTVIDKCVNRHDQDMLSLNCTFTNDTYDFIFDVPIFTAEELPYRNIYCYLCNHNGINKVFMLKFQVVCDAFIEPALFPDMSSLFDVIKSLCKYASFAPFKSSTCTERYDINIAGSAFGKKFIRTAEYYVTEIKKVNSPPDRTVYAKCNETGYLKEDKGLTKDICEREDVNVLSIHEYRIYDKVYKNFACFLCNPEVPMSSEADLNILIDTCPNEGFPIYDIRYQHLDELCNITSYQLRWFPYKNLYCTECNQLPWQRVYIGFTDEVTKNPYNYLFSMSPSDFELVQASPIEEHNTKCSSEIFNYKNGRCLLLFCDTGLQLFNDTCTPVLESLPLQTYLVSFDVSPQPDDNITIPSTDIINGSLIFDLKILCENIGQKVTSLLNPTSIYNIDIQSCQSTSIYSAVVLRKRNMYTVNSLYKQYVDMLKFFRIGVDLYINIEYTDSMTAVYTAFVKAMNTKYDFENISDIRGNHHSFSLYSTPPIEKRPFPLQVQTVILVDQFYLCAQLHFSLNETVFKTSKGNTYLEVANASFNVREYKLREDDVIICADVFKRKVNKSKPITFSESYTPTALETVHNIFTMVCTVISMTGLLLTFITYCLFSSLRTLPGKIIMTLCFFLFWSQGFLQFGLNYTKQTVVCASLGICTHFFWLGSFAAMNVCAFHTFRIFSFNEVQDRSMHTRNRSGVLYTIYTITIPALMTLTTILLNKVIPGGSGIGYGEHACFVSNFYLFLGTFLIPSCLMFLCNIIFFSIAFHKIRSSSQVRSTRERSNLSICLKLCAIIGITWPLLIIANIHDGVSWFSFLASGFNSLQGAFIFFSFVLNRRVAGLYIAFFQKERGKYIATATT